MSENKIDFKVLADQLRASAGIVVPRLLPGGRLVGQEWTCGDLTGGRGNSLKVNIQTGVWMDFASGEKGGDIISLKAAIDRCGQLEAAKSLMNEVNYLPAVQEKPAPVAPEPEVEMPPIGVPAPDFSHSSGAWCYKDMSGRVMFYIARFDKPEGKTILPYTWAGGRWQHKSWPAPRPLYGLELLNGNNSGILIVEGEKSADAARTLLGRHYAVLTWPGGSKAYNRVDWSPIYGRNITIWPDADQAGMEAASGIAGLLAPHCPQIKIIQTDKQNGWDAADALQEGWNTSSVIAWAKPLVEVLKPKPAPPAPASASPSSVAPEPVQSASINVNVIEDMPLLNESATQLFERVGMPKTKGGQPIINVHSVSMLMAALPEFEGMFWYDEFHQKCYTKMPMPRAKGLVVKDTREYSSVDNLWLLKFFQSSLCLSKLTDDMLMKAVILFCRMNTRNEVREWMEALKWDGKSRLAGFFNKFYGADQNAYTKAVGENFFTGMVARIYRPGCQLDTMVVLEGGQGIFKSQSLKAIGGKWYAEISTAIDSKDLYLVMNGNILLEIAELHAFSKSDVTKIKQVLSCQDDRYRAPYDKGPENHPRMSVFVGTTNESHWMRDHTGGRRFWPIRCRNIDLAGIKAEREQLFAEAVVRFKAGEDWYVTPKDMTLEEQEARREVDEWQDRIEDYITRLGNHGYCTLLQVAEDALKFDIKNIDLRVQRRVASILTVLGWEKSTKRLDGETKRVWRPKIGGASDLFNQDVPDYGIEGAEADLQVSERDAAV